MGDMRLRLIEALAGQYTIDREIGRGALTCVYLAEEHKHHRRVAMKVLRPELTAGLSTARFHREIAIAASLHHPHILPLLDSGEVGDVLYFTMPYVEGATVSQLIAKHSVLPIPDAVRFARQVASGLSYAHARGIIHRDVNYLSLEAGEEYIGSGLTDEIITSLSGLEALRIIAYTSAVQLKGSRTWRRSACRRRTRCSAARMPWRRAEVRSPDSAITP